MKKAAVGNVMRPGTIVGRACSAFLACALAVSVSPAAALAAEGDELVVVEPSAAQELVVQGDESATDQSLSDLELVAVQDDQAVEYGGAVSARLTSATEVTISGLNGYRTGRGASAKQFDAMANPTATITCDGNDYASNATVDQSGVVSISGNIVVGTYEVVISSDNYANKTVSFSYPAVSTVTIGGVDYEYLDASAALSYVDEQAKTDALAAFTQIGTTSIYYKVADGATALAGTLYGMDTTSSTPYSQLYNSLIAGGKASAADYDAISSATGLVNNHHYGQLSSLVARDTPFDAATIATGTDEQKLANKLTGAHCKPVTVSDPNAYVEAYVLKEAGQAVSADQEALLGVRLNGNATVDPSTVTDRVAVDTVATTGFYTSCTYFDPTALSGAKAYGHIKLVIRPTAGANSTGGTPFSWADYYESLYAGTISNGTTTVGMAPWIDLYAEAGHSAVEMSISNGTNPYNQSNKATVNRFASLYDPQNGRLKAGDYTVTLYAAGYNPLSYTFKVGGVVPVTDLGSVEFKNVDVAALEGKTATVVSYALNDGAGNVAVEKETYATDATIANGKVVLSKPLAAGDYKVVADGYTYTFEVSDQLVKRAEEAAKVKKANPLTVSAKNPAALTFKTAARTLANPLTVKNAKGALSYAKASGSKYLTVNAKSGKLTVAKSTPVGTYSIKIKATAAGNDDYEAGAVTKTVKVTVKRAANTLAVKAAKATQTASRAKKTTIAASKAFKVTKNVSKGKVTYKKVSGNAKIVVASNGKVTVKKGLKKGTYTVKVKATSAATKNYKAVTKTVSFKVRVK